MKRDSKGSFKWRLITSIYKFNSKYLLYNWKQLRLNSPNLVNLLSSIFRKCCESSQSIFQRREWCFLYLNKFWGVLNMLRICSFCYFPPQNGGQLIEKANIVIVQLMYILVLELISLFYILLNNNFLRKHFGIGKNTFI